MSIDITGRNVDVTDAIKDHIHSKLDVFFKEYPRIEHIHVILDVQKLNLLLPVT